MKSLIQVGGLCAVLLATLPGFAQRKEIKDPAEYNSYVGAIQQQDPQAKIRGLLDFVQRYPNSAYKEDALEQVMALYQETGESAKAMETARQLLQEFPNNLRALALVTTYSKRAAEQASSEVTVRGSFSETELIKGLAGGMSNKRLVTLVGEYGVDFSLTAEIEGRLRAVGADDELVEVVRKGKAKPLSEADLLKRLAGGMENQRLATLVSQYGVDFSSTPEIEERLRAAGANDELVEAIRKARATPKTPAQAAPVPMPLTVPSQLGTKVNPRDGLTYVWIPPGTFQMGCSPGDSECYGDERPAHTVTISKGFWMGQTEVTQAAYQRVVGTNPSSFHGDRLPVEAVNWGEAQAYCGAVGMRLPTEAEWEYAARVGGMASRYGDLDAIAWYNNNSGNQMHEVGQKEPNAWKLYDMLGNVWEWVADWYDDKYYERNKSRDPVGPSSGTYYRALRGGSWYADARLVRVSSRNWNEPGGRLNDGGFRCVGE